MRKLSLVIIAAAFFGLAGQKLNAQELKFGHIDTEALIYALPETDTAIARLERLGRTLSNQYEIMQVELNNKVFDFDRDAANLTDLVRQTKEQELYDLQRRIQEFQQNAQQQIQERQSEYFTPIMEKVDRAIRDVGRENGFIYIFAISSNSQGNVVSYVDETKSVDILPLAKAKLGVR